MALNMVKDYKNKALQAAVSYFKDTNNIVYRSNKVNWVPMGITMHNARNRSRLLCIKNSSFNDTATGLDLCRIC
mgnify:CR=1 FL=1